MKKENLSKQISEEYVSFEIAKLLKEKGFPQIEKGIYGWYATEYFKSPCIGEWLEGEFEEKCDPHDDYVPTYLIDKGVFIAAPTHQMAMKWLRDVHEIHIDVFVGTDEDYDADGVLVKEWSFWTYHITNTSGDSIYDAYAQFDLIEYQSYEEAVEAALKYALENLI